MVSFSIAAAHRDVQRHLEPSQHGEFDPWLAGIRCLDADDATVRRDGAALLAESADDDALEARVAVFDIPKVTEDPDPVTRAYAMGLLAATAGSVPGATVHVLPAITPRLRDSEPLVREAACRAVGWLASELASPSDVWLLEPTPDPWEDLSASTRAVFGDAVDPLLEQALASRSDESFEWQAGFDMDVPERVFWGTVGEGDDRYENIRWQATFALAMLASRFPDRIRAASDELAEVAFSGGRAETRGYVIDALGEVDAVSALELIRDRSVARLQAAEPESRTDDLARLESIGIRSGALLEEACDVLSAFVTASDETDRNLAATAMLFAAGAGVEGHDRVVSDLFEAVVTTEAPVDYSLYGDSTGTLADVAIEFPDLVLEPCLAGLGLRPTDSSSAGDTPPADQTWNTDTAWEVLLEIGRDSPDTLRGRIDTDHLLRPGDYAAPGTARKLYAEVVERPFDGDGLSMLFTALQVGEPGAKAAVRRLADRDSATVRDALISYIPDTDRPSKRMADVVARLSDRQPAAFEPVVETLETWNDDLTWNDAGKKKIVAALGRVSCATGDDRLAKELLRGLDDETTVSRLRSAGVLAALFEAFPNLAAPALLDHLTTGSPETKQRILRTLDNLDVEQLAGWSDRFNDAIIDRLDDQPWQTRLYTARVIASFDDDASKLALEDLVASADHPIVRFEAKRALHKRETAEETSG